MPTPEGFTTRAVGLDNTAVMMMASAAGVDTRMLVSILPQIEAAIINPAQPGEEEGEDDDDDA
ncbi:DUF7697 family protein [Sphingomonas sp. DC2300-3]|uniref:DUF7697 family protein n=1 Tax=unclassified Sphingomonas TaxID=196159 RepID=UPI003CFB9FF8